MTHLFTPFQLRDVTFRNRIGVSPMCQYSSEDGFANDWHLVHLGSYAVGGAGMVMAEATAVTPDGRISPGDLGIWKDDHIEMLARIFSFIEKQGAVPAIQIAHAGRKASTSAPWLGGGTLTVEEGGWLPIFAPSALAFEEGDIIPQALDVPGIQAIVQSFAEAAHRALQAGVRVIEIHAAHGYLLHEFLSPLSNHRTDEYGGSLENRTRALREVVQAVRGVWPEHLPLFVRISATDWMGADGWDADQSVELARLLGPLGVDLIDCSSGGGSPHAKIPTGPGYQVPFADRIKHDTGLPTAAVGMITTPAQADQVIRNGQADMILLAREFLRDPRWPLHAARTLHHDFPAPVQYARAL